MGTCKAFCNSCKNTTNHTVIANHKESGVDPENEVRWESVYEIIKCCGCDTVSFRLVSSNSDDFDPETGEFCEYVTPYPQFEGRQPIEGSIEFPTKTRHVYLETLKALGKGMSILSAIGIRAIIESVCLAQDCKGKNLQDSIDQLASNGLLSKQQANFLHGLRFMGNIAAHDIEAPKPGQLVAAIDIAETLLKTIYILPDMADQIHPHKP